MPGRRPGRRRAGRPRPGRRRAGRSPPGRRQPARVLLAAPADVPEATLPLVETAHFALDPIAAILSFYVMADGLAAARGRNPDAPRHLAKVTETR